jgi:hypothetical protein
MMPISQMVSVVRSPWTETLQRLVSLVDRDLIIVSPFIKRSATELIVALLDQRSLRETVRIDLLTDLRPESTLSGSMDL